jgi:hypothetical protein
VTHRRSSIRKEKRAERRLILSEAFRDRVTKEVVSTAYYYLHDVESGEVLSDGRREGTFQNVM